MILGLTLQRRPPKYIAPSIEATAFGARVIVERLEEYGVRVERVVNCGGIAARNPMVMQIYADVLNRPIAIAKSLANLPLGFGDRRRRRRRQGSRRIRRLCIRHHGNERRAAPGLQS